MEKPLALIAAAMASAFAVSVQSQTSTPHSYCFQPCTTSLSSRLSVKHVRLDDPEARFDVYFLTLPTPISVPSSGMFEGARGENRVQLEFVPRNRTHLAGHCVVATGKLLGL